MRSISLLMACALGAGTLALAQDAPKADLFLGYSFLRANSARDIPAFTNNGGLGTFAVNFNPHIAFEAEFGGYHNGNINNFEFDTTEMTYLFGPRFSMHRGRRVVPYFHTLFGGVHFTTSIPVTVAPTPLPTGTSATPTTTRVGASQDAFAMAAGGGLDIKLSHHVTLRPIQLDYVLTRLQDFGLSGTPSQNRNQNNLRYAAGLAFTFGGERPSPPVTTAVVLPPRTKQCAGGNDIPIDQECPKQNARVGIQANPTQVCPGATATVAASGAPEGATLQWSIDGAAVSQAQRLEFGGTGRTSGAYKIGLKVTARDYNDASAETTIEVLRYNPPSGSVSVSPSEIWVGDKATLTSSFTPGQCGGPVTVTYSAAEGAVSGNQFDSTNVQLAPAGASEQRKTITLMAKASDEQGSGAAQTSVVVKQRAALGARQLPDVLFAQNSDRVNNCGKRVLLEELRRLTDSDPQGRVVIVGHLGGAESASQNLDTKRALNAAAVISAGQGVCTSFPASQVLVNAVGTTENGVAYQPNFCAGSTAVTERPGQTVAESDGAARSRRVEVWFVPSGGTLPPSATNAKGAATLSVSSLGCPQ